MKNLKIIDKKTGEYINKPIDKYNHGLDAFRYSISTEIKGYIPKIEFLDRRLLGI